MKSVTNVKSKKGEIPNSTRLSEPSTIGMVSLVDVEKLSTSQQHLQQQIQQRLVSQRVFGNKHQSINKYTEQKARSSEVLPTIKKSISNLSSRKSNAAKLTRSLSSSADDEYKNGNKLSSTTHRLLERQKRFSDNYLVKNQQFDGKHNTNIYDNNDTNIYSFNGGLNSPRTIDEFFFYEEQNMLRKPHQILPPLTNKSSNKTNNKLIQKYCKRWRSNKKKKSGRTSSIEEEYEGVVTPLAIELQVTSSPEFQQVFRDLSIRRTDSYKRDAI